ncbi:hypothetical protein [Phaeobacter sp.]|uniref:hypothetical protein n=1 Tax=Phaeobacter sp. TaxID=1902409 RepID=UPI0025D57C1D|nr:hypothetical protein [Phaeobacter sp.]
MTTLSEPLRTRMLRILNRRLELLRITSLVVAMGGAVAGQTMAVGADALAAEDRPVKAPWFWACDSEKTALL